MSLSNNNKKVVSIEAYISNPEQNKKVNSPHSVKAIKMLGYTHKDIEYIPIEKYHEIDQAFLTLPKEFKKRRYEMYNNNRMQKIQEITEWRNKLKQEHFLDSEDRYQPSSSNKENGSNRNNNDDNDNNNNNTNETDEQLTSTAIKEELKQFERIKKKNEQDLINSVEYELKRQIMLKESEAKLRKQNFKLEMFNKQNEANAQLEFHKKQERERRLRQKELEIEEENRRRDKEQYIKEQERLKREAQKEEERLQENKLKQMAQEQKRLQFEEKVNKMNEQKQHALYEKMAILNQREMERQQKIEEDRIRKAMLSQQKAEQKQKQIERNKLNHEHELNKIREEFIHKQMLNEEKKKRLDTQRELHYKQLAEESQKRAEKTKNVLIKDKQIQQAKLDKYNAKQEEIAKKKKELEHENRILQEQKRQKTIEREDHIKETLEKNQLLLDKRKQDILDNIERKELATIEILNENYVKHLTKVEEQNEKMIIKQDNIQRLERLKANEREKSYRDMIKKRNRIELMQEQKRLISERKKNIQKDIAIKRQQYETEFQQLFHSKNLDEKQIQKIHDMFPNNETINALLLRLEELEQERIEETEEMQRKIAVIENELRKNKELITKCE